MKKIQNIISGIVVLLILCILSISASAETAREDEIARRIDFIQKRLDEGTTNARRWQCSWMAFYGFTSEVQFGLATTQNEKDDRNDQYDNIVGGITSLLGVGDLAFNPLVAWNAADKLRSLPETTADEKKAKLEYAEQLLKKCADREEYGRSWKTHAVDGLVSLLGGIAIAFDGGRQGDAAAFFATSMAVCELQIFTMPTRAMKDWKEYSGMSFNGSRDEIGQSHQNRFFITANPHGIFCSILF